MNCAMLARGLLAAALVLASHLALVHPLEHPGVRPHTDPAAGLSPTPAYGHDHGGDAAERCPQCLALETHAVEPPVRVGRAPAPAAGPAVLTGDVGSLRAAEPPPFSSQAPPRPA